MANNNFKKPDRGSSSAPDHIMISFCGDARHEMAVTWRTDTSARDGYVLYWAEGEKEQRQNAVCHTIKSDIDISKLNCARLSSLKAGTKYYYTCGDENNRSKTFSFTTQGEGCDSFKFIVIADHQVGDPWEKPDYSVVKNMLKKAIKQHEDIKFILTAGDNCDDGQNELQWNGMFSGLDGIVESLPYMMTTGNHDNRGFEQYLPEPKGKFYLDHADFFDEQFKYSYPQNGPKGFETENYSFDYGNVHFCIMGINEPQKVGDWAYDDINGSSAEWKLGAYHFPIYPAIPEGQNDDGYPWLRKAVESLDLIFEGHEHTFARTYPMRGDAMYEKPSEGTVHCQCGSGSGGRSANERKIWHTSFYTQEEGVPTYTLVEVSGAKLTVTTMLSDGRVADRFLIDKEKDAIDPPALPPVYGSGARMIYKGSMPHIAARGTYCEKKDGVWFCPFAVLAQYIGAAVNKKEGSAEIEMYGKRAVFFEGESFAEVNGEKISLGAAVYFGGGQLMVPASKTAEIFGLRCNYIEHNNILDFETEIESSPLSEQKRKKG